MTEEPMVIYKKCHERIPRYLRLGFVYREITRPLIEDDQLWEMAKDLPIDPDNSVDRINRAGKAVQEGKLSREKLRELMDEELDKKPYG